MAVILAKIDTKGMHYRPMNKIIRDAVAAGEKEFELDNMGGQGIGVHRRRSYGIR